MRESPAQHLEDEDTEREQVGALVDVRRAADLLERHVRDGADRLARAGEALGVHPGHLADAEIEHHRPLPGVLQREEHVARLEVAMDDAGRVRVDETAQDVIAEPVHLAPGKRSVRPDALRERLADQTLHHEERLAALGVVHFEHARNEVAADAPGR